MQNITPFLTFKTQALEAAKFYTSLFRGGKILNTSYYPENTPMPEGTVLVVEFEILGMKFACLNGPDFKFSPATSFLIPCEDQAEIDKYWNALSEGGETMDCGWVSDKFGITWQIVPKQLGELMSNPDKEKANRTMQAMLTMKKLIIADLENA